MWRDRRLCDLLGIEHPIIQAPMAGSDTAALAGAVANAGGLGSRGCAMMSPEQFGAAYGETRAATNGALNMNFFAHRAPGDDEQKAARARALLAPFFMELGLGEVPEAAETNFPFGAAIFEAVLEARPPVVSFHFGLPEARFVAALKQAGTVILCTATTPTEARDLEARGVDAIIAQGWEAGGHPGYYLDPKGSQTGTMALVPQIVDAVGVPVIAAGGIADGRGIAAALMLGASGVQLGTAFLTCPESAAHPVFRQALVEARDDETRLTYAFSGRPARGLDNRYIREMAGKEDTFPGFPILNTLTGPLRKASAEAGSGDFMSLWSGQAAALSKSLPAAELVETLVAETDEALARLGKA
ncbi:MAG: nitronate monooxygenase [Proteobacteria bacterium]|nr:nitronate monooxygenase [Pseudomonadota bacterium]